MMPTVSIIIPCYNSGKYLNEALDSILTYQDNCYEIIIVDDGSTDELTINLLNELKQKGFNIIRKENGGPASARNLGVKHAKGKYLLLLDSDNKIRHEYLSKGIEILDTHPDIAVVHGKPQLFGDLTDQNRHFETGPFELSKMLAFNYIDVCSVIRKSVWEELDGQNESRELMGYEDWEFWIKLGVSSKKFYFVNQILFDYRISPSSLITLANKPDKRNLVITQVVSKYAPVYFDGYRSLYNNNVNYINDKRAPIRAFFKFLYLKYFKN